MDFTKIKKGMKMKNIMKFILLTIMILLVGCGSENTEKDDDKIVMWLAPNAQQEAFWKEVIDEWNLSGQGMKVEAKGIPAANSSEEAILNAVASEMTPDISENINPSFAVQLAELGILEDLKKMEGYDELITSRKMEKLITGWENENKNYVFPLYVNPVLYWWRMDLLEKIGVKEVPTTYEEIYEIAKKFSKKNEKYAMTVYKGANWWDRWYDFIVMYYGASKGEGYIVNNKANFDTEAGRSVLTFFKVMFDNKWSPIQLTHEEFFTGQVLSDAKGPWDIPYAKNTFPEVFKNVKIGPVPVAKKDKVELQPTFADTKGLVIFNTSKKKEESWKFIKWVMTQEKFAKLWLEKTGMSPARGDLLELKSLEQYYVENKESAIYAKYVGVAMTPALITKQTEVQQVMTTTIIEPVIYGKEGVDEVLKKGTQKINEILEN